MCRSCAVHYLFVQSMGEGTGVGAGGGGGRYFIDNKLSMNRHSILWSVGENFQDETYANTF